MPSPRLILLSTAALVAGGCSTTMVERPMAPTTAPSAAPAITYPETAKGDVVDSAFGERVADPYRWLENDVRNDPAVAAWVAAQNRTTDAYLATLPGRAIMRQRLTQLIDYPKQGLPRRAGTRYFETRNTGLQNQATLWVRDGGLASPARLLIDPNTWAKDGATALDAWVPSEDGTRLAYSVQDGGSDWRTVRVLDVTTGAVLPDTIEWVKFSGLSWAKDGSGFFYSRFPKPADGAAFQSLNTNQAIYFHRLGTPQSADTLIYATPDRPKLGHGAGVTDDGRWLVIYSTEGTDPRNMVRIAPLNGGRVGPIRPIIETLTNDWSVIGNQGDTFFFRTDANAKRGRIVAMDAKAATPSFRPVVAEDRATLTGAQIIGGRIVAEYLADAQSVVRLFERDGRPAGTVPLPGIGTAGGFGGRDDQAETFFAFSSFATPPSIYRYDVATNRAELVYQAKVAFDPADYAVRQVFYASKDGTRVPMFIVGRRDRVGPAPTLLYGYGGFNISLTPGFAATRVAWLEQGGVLAIPNLRGGGEYGGAWHDAGRRAQKQNVFDDMIAAAEYLKAEGVASKIAVQGGSNGGLLVGAVINQRPDLFAAALPAVGVMDMLRFNRFTAGRYWTDDYGDPGVEADWRVLRAYSPLHNIRAGVEYPAVLITTADTDDRVVPGHSFKYAAALQAAKAGDKPHLIRIETRAGHGAGKPTDKVIAETADLWAFAAHWTGLTIR